MNTPGLFSSESVTEGHPDKVADYISDSVLDAFISQDPDAKVACETLAKTDRVVRAGEISEKTNTPVDFEKLVRSRIREIGYTEPGDGFHADTVKIHNYLHEQSPDIAQGVVGGSEIAAGDQGMMFGYASDETPELMPAPIWLAHRMTKRLTELRKSGELSWLRPDGKVQVTLEYDGQKVRRVHTLVLSTQHKESVSQDDLKAAIKSKIFDTVVPQEWEPSKARSFINPTGRFVIGGPHGDSGLTGRKIIVDTYGGMAPHGGGAFSGKDPTKVDRSAAYLARYIAKNVVAAGLAKRFMVQIAYAIGVPEPVSLFLEDYGTSQVDLQKLTKLVREVFPMKPGELIKELKLNRPFYSKTTCYGHFGREDADFSWEKTDKAALLKKEF